MKESHVLITAPEADYELIDSGDGEKLERFGAHVLSRPDPQALWKKHDQALWKNVSGSFTRDEKKGEWALSKDLPARWEISFSGLKFVIKPTAFKHVGLFPEQSVNWRWLSSIILEADNSRPVESSTSSASSTILNLFGYTGGATLACSQAGAHVVHVDGSKAAIAWARENAELSHMGKNPIRWILDDARTFVKREIKREKKYEGIIMDPPAFGHGPDNELWKIEEHFLPLVDDCMKLLTDKPLFFMINGYSAGYSAVAYENILKPLVIKYGGSIEIGELTLEESGTKGVSGHGRLLPCGIFARWSRD